LKILKVLKNYWYKRQNQQKKIGAFIQFYFNFLVVTYKLHRGEEVQRRKERASKNQTPLGVWHMGMKRCLEGRFFLLLFPLSLMSAAAHVKNLYKLGCDGCLHPLALVESVSKKYTIL